MRRRLLILSAPVAVLVVVAALKMISVAVIGHSAVSDYARGDGPGLRNDAARLGVINVIEPARAPFTAGAADVLDGRLADADVHFGQALDRSPGSCEVRVNLELVRETQGDVEAAAGRTAQAVERYTSALDVVSAAPPNCFAGNADPQPDRRQVRQDTAGRLKAKLTAAQTVSPDSVLAPSAPPPPPPPATSGAPADETPPALGRTGTGLSDIAPDRLPSPGASPPGPHRLDPRAGDPLDRLRQLLTDAASSGD